MCRQKPDVAQNQAGKCSLQFASSGGMEQAVLSERWEGNTGRGTIWRTIEKPFQQNSRDLTGPGLATIHLRGTGTRFGPGYFDVAYFHAS
jgi:hypothetical protein